MLTLTVPGMCQAYWLFAAGRCRYRPAHAPAAPARRGTRHGVERRRGMGVLRTPDGLDVWCHYSHVMSEGHAALTPGEAVVFDFETPGQDDYPARVLTSARRH